MAALMTDGNDTMGPNVRVRSFCCDAQSVPVSLIFCLDLNPTIPFPSSLSERVNAATEAVSVGQKRGEYRTDRGNRIGSVTGQYQLSICRD